MGPAEGMGGGGGGEGGGRGGARSGWGHISLIMMQGMTPSLERLDEAHKTIQITNT